MASVPDYALQLKSRRESLDLARMAAVVVRCARHNLSRQADFLGHGERTGFP